MRDMTATVLSTSKITETTSGLMSWVTAEAWIRSLNATAEDRARGFEWCRVGIHGRVKHRLGWRLRPDGRRVYGPVCNSGYDGDPADRVHPVSSLSAGEFCKRLACVHATPPDYVPGFRSPDRPEQLELDLLVG